MQFSVKPQYLHCFNLKIGAFIFKSIALSFNISIDTGDLEISALLSVSCPHIGEILAPDRNSSLFDLIARLCFFVTEKPFWLNHSGVVCFSAFILERVVQHANELMQSHCYCN